MKGFILSLILLCSFPSVAGGVYLGGWSIHAPSSTNDYNGTHNLIAVEYQKIFAGTMVNSYNNRSFMVGYDFDLSDQMENEYIGFGIITGGITGYSKENTPLSNLSVGDVSPLLALYVDANTPYIKPTIIFMGNAAMITFKLRF